MGLTMSCKERVVALLSAPILLAVGFLATKLGERYSQALNDINYDLDYE